MVAPRPASRRASPLTRFLRVSIGSVHSPLAWMSRCSRFLATLAFSNIEVQLPGYDDHIRLLQAARLSRDTDESTSIEKQDADMRRWAHAHGHEIIGTAADTDVSGSRPPWERPELGPWLTHADKISQY